MRRILAKGAKFSLGDKVVTLLSDAYIEDVFASDSHFAGCLVTSGNNHLLDSLTKEVEETVGNQVFTYKVGFDAQARESKELISVRLTDEAQAALDAKLAEDIAKAEALEALTVEPEAEESVDDVVLDEPVKEKKAANKKAKK